MLYRISPLFARRQKALELSGTPQEMFAIERLMREGVRGDTARDLVVSHGAERCLRYAEALDAQEGIRNRASFLVSAIRKGYALPGPPTAGPGTWSPLEPSLIAQTRPRSEETEPHPPETPRLPSPTSRPGGRRALGPRARERRGRDRRLLPQGVVRGRHRGGPGIPIPHDLGAHALRQGVHRNALPGERSRPPYARNSRKEASLRVSSARKKERIGWEVNIILGGLPFAVFLYLLPWF